MLNDQERLLVESVFSRGPTALLSIGYTVETATAWMRRPDVAEAFLNLDREYRNQDMFAARTRFVAKRALSQFVQGAVAILAQGMAGPVYMRDKDGGILTDGKGHPRLMSAGPTVTQLSSATSVLDRLGVDVGKKDIITDVLNMLHMLGTPDAKKLPLESEQSDLDEEQRALSRERVRVRIEQGIRDGHVKLGHAKMAEVLKAPAGKKPKRKAINTVSQDHDS